MELVENLEEIMDSRIFIPGEVVRSIQLDAYVDLIKYIKNQKFIIEKISAFDKKYREADILKVNKEMLDKIESFDREKTKTIQEVYYNQNKYIRKNTKVNLE